MTTNFDGGKLGAFVCFGGVLFEATVMVVVAAFASADGSFFERGDTCAGGFCYVIGRRIMLGAAICVWPPVIDI